MNDAAQSQSGDVNPAKQPTMKSCLKDGAATNEKPAPVEGPGMKDVHEAAGTGLKNRNAFGKKDS